MKLKDIKEADAQTLLLWSTVPFAFMLLTISIQLEEIIILLKLIAKSLE